QVIGELVQIGTIDAGIDQDQPTLRTHRDGIAPDPRALPDPDAVGHLIQLVQHGAPLPADGRMLWLRWKTLSGSKRSFREARRVIFVARYARRTPASPSSPRSLT